MWSSMSLKLLGKYIEEDKKLKVTLMSGKE